MKKVFFIGFLITLSQNSLANQNNIAFGTAVTKADAVAYHEEHHMEYTATGQLKKIITIYKDTEKKEFGKITSEFDKHPYLPTYEFVDNRFGRIEGVSWENKDTLKAYFKKNKDDKPQEKHFKLQKNFVTGQGLHAFIHANLSSILKNEEPVHLKYLLPANQDYYSLRLRLLSKNETEKTARLSLEFDNWFMRLLVPQITLKYSYELNRLMTFEGTSNLVDIGQKTQKVTISYSYPQMQNARRSSP